MAAHEQGRFWDMHDRLLAQQTRLDRSSLEEHAQLLGLDMTRFRAALDQGQHRSQVAADVQVASDAGVDGTPTMFVNGEILVGLRPVEVIKAKVADALARAKSGSPGTRL